MKRSKTFDVEKLKKLKLHVEDRISSIEGKTRRFSSWPRRTTFSKS
ncbi:MAG: hypothetical protein HN368_02240 [Spirochaetales bacterium]|nr:hypothetical protein [Spirochaetales bacterium]